MIAFFFFFWRFVQKKAWPIVLSYVVLNSAYMVPLLCLVNPSVPYPIFSIAILTPEGSEKLLDLILSYHVGTYVCISFSFNSWICFLKSTYLQFWISYILYKNEFDYASTNIFISFISPFFLLFFFPPLITIAVISRISFVICFTPFCLGLWSYLQFLYQAIQVIISRNWKSKAFVNVIFTL